jgi:hypothetical protein
LDTSGTDSQPPSQARPTLPGEHLAPLEEAMLAMAKTGEWVDCGEGPFDLAAMQSWGRERAVSAAVLRDLLVGGLWPVHARGVRLRGVLISGLLDLEGATLRCPLSLDGCYLDASDPVCFDHATALRIALTKCQLAGGLTANMLTARHVDLSRSTLLKGPLSLMCANISDELICSGAQLNGTDRDLNALVAGGIKVGGSVYLDPYLDDKPFTADGAVWLARADIGGDLACGGAQLGSNSDGIGLLAEGVKVGGHVFLREGFKTDGAVRLLGADIRGDLSCRAARLGRDRNGNALVADRMTVGGEVHLYKGFTADGAVVLNGADITGDLSLSGARLTGADYDGNALVADGMKAHHDVLLGKEPAGDGEAGQPFTAAGAVRLARADIAGQLICSGAQLNRDNDGNALIADGIKVGRDVSLDKAAADDGEAAQPFTAAGTVRLTRAEITGQLSCSGAQLNRDNNGNALVADGIKVGAAVLLNEGLTAAGTVSLNSARADRLVLSPAKPAGADEITFNFTAKEAQIAGELQWAPDGQFAGRVNLEDARVGELEDNNWTRTGKQARGYWPPDGQLRLSGFTYGGLGEASVQQRLEWIRSQYEGVKPAALATQPYEQLAAMYRQAGQDTEARVVAIARRRDLRKYGNLNWYRKFGNWFLDETIRYGYQTWRAAAGLAAVFVVFLVLSVFGQHQHVIVPTGDVTGLRPAPTAMQCTSDYPCFYPLGYTIDTVIPIINVHQADHWGPDGHASAGLLWVVAAWGATAAGWALATLLVAGYTGLVRQT